MELTETTMYKVVRKCADGTLVSAHPELAKEWQVQYMPHCPAFPVSVHSFLFAFLADQEEAARSLLEQMRSFYPHELFQLWRASAQVVETGPLQVTSVEDKQILAAYWHIRYSQLIGKPQAGSFHLPYCWEAQGVFCASITLDFLVDG
ncbi:MAG TPA: hypothetical protein VKR06_25080 [Ktedonosporobacter sp.]|nr:hypothetical protein [Ktedonosporobacter sp.]